MSKLCLLFLFCVVCFNQAFALDSSDKEAIENVIKNYAIAWNDHEGKGFGDGFTEDADFVNIFGMHFSGKEEIERRHLHILQTFSKGSKLQISNTRLREVYPGLVIALVRWRVEGFRDPGSDMSQPGNSREGIFTQVFIKQNGKWEITASQNTVAPQ